MLINRKKKLKIFIDADDTILNSSEVVIDILNQRYNLNPSKSYENLTDWGYKSIYGYLGPEELYDIYDSDEFFNKVTVEPQFIEFCNEKAIKKHIDVYIVTKGTKKNLEQKRKLFGKALPEAKIIGYEIKPGNKDYSKNNTNMRGGIHIDDRADCLASTNASRKILFTHGRRLPWNDVSNFFIDNRYDCSNWKEIIETLNFFVSFPEYVL